MIALYIIGGILLLILLLCLLPVGIRIKYSDDLSLSVTVGPVRRQIVPKKEKKIKLSDYSEKALEKKRRKQAKKDAKKKKKKNAPAHGKPEEKKDSVLVSRLKHIDTAPDMIAQLYDILVIVVDKFAKRLRIKIFELDAIIGSDNAAKTAILYGGACSLAGVISSFLAQHTELSQKKKSINIAPDFLSEKTAVSADISLYVFVGGVFSYIFEIRKVIFEILDLLQEEKTDG